VVQAQAQHPIFQLSSYGATPLAYLMPAARNPVFHFLYNFHPNDFTEQTLFFGYTTIILALACVILLRQRDPWLRTPRRWWTSIFFAVLVPAAFVMSLPRTYQVGPITLYMPSTMVSEFTTFWRVYARFGVVVGFALAVLAALALSSLAQRRYGALLAPVAIGLVACLEFLPGHVTAFSTTAQPPYVAWLASHPGGIVATYPPALDQDPGIYLSGRDYWYQRSDGHPRFAFFGSGTIDTHANAIRLLSRYVTDPLTPGILATENVRYVILHEDVYRAQGQTPPIPDPSHFHLVARLPGVRIFSVSAPRVDINEVVATHALEVAQVEGLHAPNLQYGAGFNPPEQFKGTLRRWMTSDGVLLVHNEQSRVTKVLLTGLAFSNAAPRLLQISDQHGKVLARQTVPTSEVPVALGPFKIPAGTFTLRLTATPGAARLGANDNRFASVFLSPLELTAIPDYPDAP
jgi:hypothetical protein